MNYKEFAEKKFKESQELLENRNDEYGNAFENFGELLSATLGDIKIETAEDWNRIAPLFQIIGKLKRYTSTFNKGGHKDSLEDIINYCIMLLYLDDKYKDPAEFSAEAMAEGFIEMGKINRKGNK